MQNKLLPIGSVVLLKNASKRLMITGYHALDKENDKKYDYCGCLYPEGMIEPDKIALFNHNQILELFFIGFQDIEEIEFMKKFTKLIDKKQNPNVNNI